MKRYLIIGYSRSGTTAVHTALMGHPEVGALEGELKPAPFFTEGMAVFTGGYVGKQEDERGHRELFDMLTSINRPASNVRGAKIACNDHRQAQVILDLVAKKFPEMYVIHVVRGDEVAHFGSIHVANKTGVFHSWQKPTEAKRTRLPLLRLLHVIRAVRRLNDVMRLRMEHSERYLQVRQEDLSNPAAFYSKLFSFLGIEQIEVTWQPAKKVLPPPREYITNYTQAQRWAKRLRKGSVYELLAKGYGFAHSLKRKVGWI